jgi:hypothetical protein
MLTDLVRPVVVTENVWSRRYSRCTFKSRSATIALIGLDLTGATKLRSLIAPSQP